MIATAHVLSGFLCGLVGRSARTNGSRIVIAFGLGLLSHVVLDILPHSDYGSLSRSMALVIALFEVAATTAIAGYFVWPLHLPGLRASLLMGLAGAMIPDAKSAQAFLPRPAARWVQTLGDWFHSGIHAAPTPLAVGLTTEIACTLLLLFGFALYVRRHLPVRVAR